MTSAETRTSSEQEHGVSPIQLRKLGHVVFRVSDVERSTRFWTEIMGFKVSDHNERGMVFLRHGSDHHSIALAKAEAGDTLPGKRTIGFDHLALEVASVSDLFRIRDFLRDRNVPILYEGRRGAGSNPGIEFQDPDGYTFEVYAAMDQIGEDGQSRPSSEWRRATSLEQALAEPVEGVTY
jgi:catechol 2,3-dioxygenase-like lactoylglutathione lyase family enzyme